MGFEAWEFKWSTKKKAKLDKEFDEIYKPRPFKTISKDNWEEFLLD